MAEPVQILGKSVVQEYIHFSESVKSRVQHQQPSLVDASAKEDVYKIQIVWRNIFLFLYLHAAAFYGIYCGLVLVQWKTFLWTYFVLLCSIQGTGSGVHRLWAHRAYKAKLPLRILLCVFQTISLQNHIYEWCRDHRAHHKFTDTDADPHNAKRGFFFSHMGWLLCRKHPAVIAKGRTVDLSDLRADPVVMFQKRYYLVLAPLFCFVLPTAVPWYFWGEHLHWAWCFTAMFRYVLSLHGTWLVNSAAHIYGMRPYDKTIQPTENIQVSYITMGEGFHNYHHIFPWDYRAAELGNNFNNFSARFIEFMARIGWAYDLKTVSLDLIEKRVKRTGDGSRETRLKNVSEKDGAEHSRDLVWGWGDEDMQKNDINLVSISHRIDGVKRDE